MRTRTRRTPTEPQILAAFRRECGRHDNPAVVNEHGGKFVSCFACGALWSVAFDQNADPIFDAMEHGDESCRPFGRS